MNLPPRVKTQYPRIQDIIENEIIPVPIETVFFKEDGKQDPYQQNRYYFDYPGNWVTSNNGENIIGLRSIKLHRSPIKLHCIIKVVKYIDEDFDTYSRETFNETIDYLLYIKKAILVDLHVIDYIKTDDLNYDNFFEKFNETMFYYINNGWAEGFKQNQLYPQDRDILVEDYYDKNGYHIKIYSPRTDEIGSKFSLCYRLFYANDDFKELFNIIHLDTSWKNEIVFDKIWDLKPCNVYSSLAEQSLHHYIGTTDTIYPEIKYFKLNSSDQRFWVEFHSIGYYSAPACFPKSISFTIEIQFQSFNKRLNG